MNIRKINTILAIAIIMTILPVCTQAVPIPYSIAGTVYQSDGVTQASAGTNVNVTDTMSGYYIEGTTGSGPNNGGYAVAIDGENGDTVLVKAWNTTHYGTTTITLLEAMTGIDVILNIPVTDITPPASVSNLDEADKGTTWIQWSWINPSDSDFSHTEIYLNGIHQTITSAEFFNATALTPYTEYTISTQTVDTSGNINTSWINNTATTVSNDNWKNEWIGEDSEGGSAVTTTELQEAIHHWLEDIPVRRHIMSTTDLQEIIVIWLSG